MKTLLLALVALLLVGCAPAPPVTVDPTPDPLPEAYMAVVKSAAVEDQMSVLSALVVLRQAGFIGEWVWTAPTGGSPVGHYQFVTTTDVQTESILILLHGKTNMTHVVRGVDDLGHTGPWSIPSERWPDPVPEATDE